jgi:hypothetical protein
MPGSVGLPARMSPSRTLTLPALLGASLIVAGCGGGSAATKGEPSASFSVEVAKASFPAKQAIATPQRMELVVHNSGARPIPNVAITVDSFNYTSNYAELAADKRPIWVIEQGPGAIAKPPVQTQEVSTPGGGQTAYLNTWALGRLPAGRSETFSWRVMPVKAGSYTVHYAVSAGLAGKAKARLASGGPASGRFAVTIAGAPRITQVDPKTGKVVAGTYPASP